MTHRGWFRAYRKLFDPRHDMAGDVACRRFAWLDLVGMATHEPTTRGVGLDTVDLERGELVVSVRYLAERWGWSKSRVTRWLSALEKRSMIRSGGGTPVGTVYAVASYDTYNPTRDSDGDSNGDTTKDSSGTAAGQQRDKGKNSKNKRTKEPSYSDEFEKFWAAYPKRSGGNPKWAAWGAWCQRVTEGHTPEIITDGLLRYVRHLESDGKVGTQFVKQAKSFLSARDTPFLEVWEPVKPLVKLDPNSQAGRLRNEKPRQDRTLERVDPFTERARMEAAKRKEAIAAYAADHPEQADVALSEATEEVALEMPKARRDDQLNETRKRYEARILKLIEKAA